MIVLKESVPVAVKVAHEILGAPVRGVTYGNGVHREIPKELTEEDMLSGDPKRVYGWTGYFPDKDGALSLTDDEAKRLTDAKPSDSKAPTDLAVVQAAIAKTPVTATTAEKPVAPAPKGRRR